MDDDRGSGDGATGPQAVEGIDAIVSRPVPGAGGDGEASLDAELSAMEAVVASDMRVRLTTLARENRDLRRQLQRAEAAADASAADAHALRSQCATVTAALAAATSRVAQLEKQCADLAAPSHGGQRGGGGGGPASVEGSTTAGSTTSAPADDGAGAGADASDAVRALLVEGGRAMHPALEFCSAASPDDAEAARLKALLSPILAWYIDTRQRVQAHAGHAGQRHAPAEAMDAATAPNPAAAAHASVADGPRAHASAESESAATSPADALRARLAALDTGKTQ